MNSVPSLESSANPSVSTPSAFIVAGTGHRPDKLGGYGKVAQGKVFEMAKKALKDSLELAKDRPLKLISGMALGWDQALALAAVELEIPFCAAVPMRGFQQRWPAESQSFYFELLKEAAKVVYVDEVEDIKYQRLNGFVPPGLYSVQKMQTRNVWMVDKCHHVVALWDGSAGGTKNCLDYVRGCGKPWRNYYSEFSGASSQMKLDFM